MELKHINTEISQLATMQAVNMLSEHGKQKLKEFRYLKSLHESKVKNLGIHSVSVSFLSEGLEKVDKYHKQTLNKVNKLYKYLYDRTVCATELADQQDEVFAYLQLTDDVKEAYKKFRDTVCGLANER